jgi:hypothetical protein
LALGKKSGFFVKFAETEGKGKTDAPEFQNRNPGEENF